MNITGTVMGVEFNVTIPKLNGDNYQGARFSYRDSTGALKEQAFHKNSLKFNPALKNQLEQLEVGKGFTMVKEKEGDFWNVKGIYGEGAAPASEAKASPAKGTVPPSPAPKSNYETSEERAQRQVYIIRQSSLSNAVAALAVAAKKAPSANEVIQLAKQFEAYVFDTEFDDGTIMTLKSDDMDIQ